MTRALITIAVLMGMVRLVAALPGAISSAWAEYEAHREAAERESFLDAWASRRPHTQVAHIRYVRDSHELLLATVGPYSIRR